MTRQLEYEIRDEIEMSVREFLQQQDYSRAVLIALKATEDGILCNGKEVNVNARLKKGDRLKISLEETIKGEALTPDDVVLDVLYEDEDVLVINKTSDTPIHPSVNNYTHTLANKVYAYQKRQNETYPFRCINRLDRDTTGVTVIAKNLLSASILAKQLQEGQVKRQYVALVEGHTKEKGNIEAPIGRAPDSIIERCIDPLGQYALTYYKTLKHFEKEDQDLSFVALQLATGRTHQIRVHMKSIGHPLLGDFLYNPNNQMTKRQALHGRNLTFCHPITKKEMSFSASLPADMKKILDENEYPYELKMHK